jgi:hypothetical protein
VARRIFARLFSLAVVPEFAEKGVAVNMLLYPPKHFDANEWYIILTTVLGYGVLYFFPKRYPHAISVLLVLFCVSAATVYDHTIAWPPLELYDINDRKSYEWFDAVTYLMYSPYALICVYVYDKANPKGLWFTAYIVLWSALCVLFEWLAIRCHVFTFHRWNLFYSLSVYLVMTTLYIRLYHYLLRKWDDPSATSYTN